MKDRIPTVAAGVSLGVALALRQASRIPVFDVMSESSPPWLLTSLPSWWSIVILAGLGAVAGSLLPARTVGPFVFAGVIASAVLVPPLFAVVPFIAAFSGHALDFVLLACALLVVWRSVRMPEVMTANRAGALALCVFLAVGFKVSSDVGFSGDEPHYLLITHSVVEDGDIRVQNNYFDEDYQRFYLGKIGPHLAAGTPYSVHGIGLSMLLVPGYAVAGVAGVLVTLALIGALGVRSLYRAGELLGLSGRGATFAAAMFALTSPGLFLSVAAYPELPASVIVMLVVVYVASTPGHGPGRGSIFWLALLVGSLPWFHLKFAPLATVLWCALFLRGTTRRTRVAVALAAVTSAAALVTFFYVTTGSFDPTASYGRQRVFASAIPNGLLGLLFDQEFGLLMFAPIYLGGLVGLVALTRRHPLFGVLAFGVVAAVALPGAAHPLWSGGNSPPARFLFPALPLLALALGSLWSWERKWGIAPWLPALASLSLAVAGLTVWLPGQPLHLNARDGTGRLWEVLSSSWDITPYLPSIVNGDTRSLVFAVAGVFIIMVLAWLQFRQRSARLPAFATVLLVAACIQDLTGVEQPRAQSGRWVTELMHERAANASARYLGIPAFERLTDDDVAERVILRLRPLRPDGDPRHWWSLPYSLPAGRFRVAGVVPDVWAPCNDRSCFDIDGAGLEFDSHVALSRFRIRSRRLRDLPPRIYFESVHARAPVAERSLAIPGGARLHGLDDNAYLDPKGFWVKRATRAEFALEAGATLRLANGGRENVVVVRTSAGDERFELSPWEQARFNVPAGPEASRFSIESEGGFRPSELDPAAADHRDLGVFVGATAFDLRR